MIACLATGGGLVRVTAAQAQTPREDAARRVDGWLAESRRIPLDPPRAVEGEFVALPSSRKLLAAALVRPVVSRHVSDAVLDSKRPAQERVYGLLLAGRLMRNGEGHSACLPTQDELDSISKQAREPALQYAAEMAWVRYRALRAGSRSDLELDRRSFYLRKHPWSESRMMGPDLFPVDRALAQEILEALPQNPRLSSSDGPAEVDVKAPTIQGKWGRKRLVGFFAGDNVQPEAVGLLLDEHATSSWARQELFWAIYGWQDLRSRDDKLRGRITALARQMLLQETDPSRTSEEAIFIVQRSGTMEDARALVAALRRTKDPKWQEMLRDGIEGLVTMNRWPAELSLDGLFPDGPPKPLPPERTTAYYRRSPRALIEDPHPAFREKGPEKQR